MFSISSALFLSPIPNRRQQLGFCTTEPYLHRNKNKKMKCELESEEWLGENRWRIGGDGELPSDLMAAMTSSLRRTFSMSWTSGCLRRKSLWASTRCGCWVPSSLSMAAVNSVADSLSLERVWWVLFLFGFLILYDSLCRDFGMVIILILLGRGNEEINNKVKINIRLKIFLV